MPSSFTPNYNLELIVTGELANLWGGHVNSNFTAIDTAIHSNATLIGTNNSDVALLKQQMASTALAIVSSGLQTQITNNSVLLASTAAAPVTSGLQTQITAASTLASTANGTATAASTAAGTANTNATAAVNTANAANATAGTANNTANAANSTSGANTTAIGALQALASVGSIRAASTSTGTITADWLILKQALPNGQALGFEVAFGRGRGQEGDTIPLPAGFTTGYYVEAAMAFVSVSSPPTQLIVQVSGLTLSAVHALVSGSPVGRGSCQASWWCFAWRTGVA